ncbi:MAG TPA: O-antigen ligase family protein [Terracidiphilus sp.]|nr:O-antigen ligase family protein [Terracidiphilus sp.]
MLALIVSLPALMKSFLLKNSQSLALIGLAIAVSLSELIGRHWAGGAVMSFFSFIPNGMAYFLVCLHCNSKRRLQILTLMVLFICLVVIAHGYIDLMHGVPTSGPPPGEGFGDPPETGATASPYLMRQMNNIGDWTYRLQGLGALNDPNDFGQLLVTFIPLMFIFWRAKKMISNVALVILPVAALLFGVFLTHSRGALVALTAVAIVAARRRIGTLPAVMLAGSLFLAAMALHFTGGRDISAGAGEDRTALWGQGLQLFKTHPLFGVGYGDLWEYTDVYLTAHNSIIVCAGELGLFGLYFWSLYLFTTLRDTLTAASPQQVSDGERIVPEEDFDPHARWRIEHLDKEEINRLGRLMVLSLIGFLVAGWFLSRAFVMTLFLLGGMTEAIYEMAVQRGMIAPRLPLNRVLLYSAALAGLLILVMYVMVRILNLMH